MVLELKLTKNQLSNCESEVNTKKHWSEKIKHCLKIFNQNIPDKEHKIDESNIQWFIESFLPAENRRHKREFFEKSQKGIINTYLTPTDIDGSFGKIEKPFIGGKYHLSWAFKGAVFQLVKIDEDNIHGYVDNPKYRRVELLKIKLSDLRKLKNK